MNTPGRSAGLADGLDLAGPPAYNKPPGTQVLLLHRLPEGACHVDRLNWGYRPHWATTKSIPPAINARIEKAASGRFFAPLWRAGRVIVPADGWYEWTGKPGHKQPWYIRLESDSPMFLAAIAGFRADRDPDRGCGLAIVTESADAGMVDVHDRRPVVFSAEDALLWLDTGLAAEQAEQLARSRSRPAQDFVWYPVGKRVNRAGNEGPDLIEPIKLPLEPEPGLTPSMF
ncbi:MAG: SOS response-associated peptidase family protein [Lacisediminimonas sp.]|nr:SOS response-associated peptidase family protein [Lacisediminimonas sp.]